mgnify:CR=1 FL=1|tara:strand:+ start:1043 stop:2149 length:1107 start_codon:yes stop_codon:yes gene_type:complete
MQKQTLKSRILFLVQLPPPVHGSSLVNKIIVNNENVKSRYDIDIIEIQLAKNMEDLGNFSFSKVVNAFIIFFKLLKNMVFKKHELAYLTLSPIGFAFYKDAILILILKMFSKKTVLHLHGKGIKDQLNSTLKNKIYAFVFKNSEVIHLATSLYDDIKEIYPKTPYYLPNGIPGAINKYNARTEKRVTFLFLSNLMKDKGIIVLLEAIKSLQFIKEKFKVYIIGPSSDITIDEVKRYLAKNNIENVEVLGPIYGEDKYLYLNKSDVFVLPTFNDCFPLTILEAFQTGLAVISTNIGAIPDMVKNNVNGFIMPQNDSGSLAGKMKYLIENSAILNKMKIKNKLEYSEKYTEQIFIENYIKIMDEIVAKKQ